MPKKTNNQKNHAQRLGAFGESLVKSILLVHADFVTETCLETTHYLGFKSKLEVLQKMEHGLFHLRTIETNQIYIEFIIMIFWHFVSCHIKK
jgi:hypothetical protein